MAKSNLTQPEKPAKNHRPQPGQLLLPFVAPYEPAFSWDFNTPRAGAELLKYDEIANFHVVKASLDVLLAGIFWNGWTITPGDNQKNSALDDLSKRIVDDCLWQLDHFEYMDFEESLKGWWQNAVIFGNAVSEISYGYNKKIGIIVNALYDKHPALIDYYVQETGDFKGLIYYSGNPESGRMKNPNPTIFDVDVTQFEYQIFQATFPRLRNGNWYGDSEMKAILNLVNQAKVLESAATENGLRMAGNPIVFIFDQIGMTKAQQNALTDILSKVGTGSVVGIPSKLDTQENKVEQVVPSVKIDVIKDRANADGLKFLGERIEFIYKQITRTLGIPDELGFTTTGVGSLAKAKEQVSLYTSRVISQQQFLSSALNRRFIPKLYQYNYDLPEVFDPPRFSFNIVEEDSLKTMVEAMVLAKNAGFLSQSDNIWIRPQLGFPDEVADEPTQPASDMPLETQGDTEVPEDEKINVPNG